MRSSRAARFAAAWAVLDVLHDVADHIVQTDGQADPRTGKAGPSGWLRPMTGHLVSYHLTQVAGLALLRTLGVRPSRARTGAAVLLSAATHGFLDRRWPVLWLLDWTGSQRFARPQVQAEVRGQAVPSAFADRHPTVEGEAVGPLPLHGPYLADQASHRLVLLACAWVISR